MIAYLVAWGLVIIMVAMVGLPLYIMWKKGLFRSKF